MLVELLNDSPDDELEEPRVELFNYQMELHQST